MLIGVRQTMSLLVPSTRGVHPAHGGTITLTSLVLLLVADGTRTSAFNFQHSHRDLLLPQVIPGITDSNPCISRSL